MASIPVAGQIPSSNEWTAKAIEICERGASALLFASLSPVVASAAAVVAVCSGRAPFIAHRRVGWRGTTLWMLKLRTMWGPGQARVGRTSGWVEYIEDSHGPELKQAADPRVPNSFARFCRRHSIDELPQLWHVIRGEMALVGPRPVTAEELRRHYGSRAQEMLEVKPGIAGLWQISGRNRLSYAERCKLDLEFVRHRSLRMYLWILVRTLPEVLRGENSW